MTDVLPDGKRLREVFSRERIRERVLGLAREISQAFAGEPYRAVCVLNGAFLFFADLVRELDSSLRVDFVQLSSYGDATQSSGTVRLLKDIDFPAAGANILLVEDVVDSGRSLDWLLREMRRRGAARVAACALVDKQERREVDVEVDFIGFRLEQGFLVGYGMDLAGGFRNLPAIYEVVDAL